MSVTVNKFTLSILAYNRTTWSTHSYSIHTYTSSIPKSYWYRFHSSWAARTRHSDNTTGHTTWRYWSALRHKCMVGCYSWKHMNGRIYVCVCMCAFVRVHWNDGWIPLWAKQSKPYTWHESPQIGRSPFRLRRCGAIIVRITRSIHCSHVLFIPRNCAYCYYIVYCNTCMNASSYVDHAPVWSSMCDDDDDVARRERNRLRLAWRTRMCTFGQHASLRAQCHHRTRHQDGSRV